MSGLDRGQDIDLEDEKARHEGEEIYHRKDRPSADDIGILLIGRISDFTIFIELMLGENPKDSKQKERICKSNDLDQPR